MKQIALSPVWRRLILAAAVVAVLIPTMGPAPRSESTPTFCLVCGEQGGADVIANIILFLPVGIALALQGWRVRYQLLFAFALTLFIESSQSTLIPGRDASLGDLVFNTVGAAVGIGLVTSFRLWLTPSPVAKPLLQIAAGLFAGGTILLTGVLTQPQLGAQRYRSQWTQRLSRTDWYRGTVESVTLGSRPLPEGYFDEPNFVRDSILKRSRLSIRGIAGPPPAGFGPIFTVRAQRNRDIWTVGQEGTNLTLNYRPVAASFRLLRPDIQLVGLMTQHEGDVLSLDFRRRPPGFDITVGDRTFFTSFHPHDGWRLIVSLFESQPRVRIVLGVLWVAGLFFPLGLWMDRSWGTGAAVGIVALSLLVVAGTQLLGPPGWIELVGCIVGLVLGGAVHTTAAHTLRDVSARRVDLAAERTA